MGVRALLALRDGVDSESERLQLRDFWITFAAIFGLIFLLSKPTTIRRDLDRLERRVEQLEQREAAR